MLEQRESMILRNTALRTDCRGERTIFIGGVDENSYFWMLNAHSLPQINIGKLADYD